MRQRGRGRRNAGFTLVELIISVAILGIIGLSASGFLVTGSRVYSSVSYSVRLQYESQLAMNQMQDYVLDCDAGAAWDSANQTLYLVSGEDGARTMRVFHYDGGSGQLLYGAGAASETGVTAGDLMAEHLTGMNVALQPASERTGRTDEALVTMTFSRGGKSYTGTQTIALRNCPLAADDWSTLWGALNA